MQRYFIPKEQFVEDKVHILDEDAFHLNKVMRAKVEDQFIVSNGETRDVLVEIEEITKNKVTASIIKDLERNNEPVNNIWIAQSLPKGDKMDTIIQKCTEIGAVRFIPFTSERTIVQYDEKKKSKRIERWNKISKEAAEQAHRNRVPKISEIKTLKELLKMVSEAEESFVFYESEDGLYFKDMISKKKDHEKKVLTFLLVVGPEGGFTADEISQLETAGCHSVSLGKRILRTETAAMVGLTCMLYEYDEMGG
ncbi:16S rRNA (uracil(1498)-N(3))-methyltransferase [Chengkuizengella axinellae]|uniref:Ribosomal RNA small subunit methyltransferase E n=1 Tax=Chengkuizengella axinellae TaxID=3064388 RepID=A0ABT9IUQ3_9BACL|nr:16S rRNA (uracil(1498)-N(3))-methyltransferase [Chengkuizengella sp. 2205SS18-9]MDP5273076.1 16S rRNA (uracil(1498)-N(3))-methyltransferase [Chengkuizengella sp. 2205SS18-9]